MQFPIAMAFLVASVPIILILCKVMGPRSSTVYALLGSFLILPRYNPDEKILGIFTFDKLTAPGIAMAIGLVAFDLQTLKKIRVRWVDGPILLYIAAPLIDLALGKTTDVRGSLDQAWLTLFQWGVPYALGRLYFCDREGPRRLSIAVVIAATLIIPFCFFEVVMGSGWFLRFLIFRIPTDPQIRLGGSRPSLMVNGGLELAAWMALSTVLATWLWASRERWRTRYLPAWLPPVALLLTTIACRSIYGYLTLALGLSTIGLLLVTRTRWILVPLLMLPLAYVGLRATGIWDGQIMVQLAGSLGEREVSSVGLRLQMEDQFIKASTDHDLFFGLGGLYSESWADGWWLTLLKRGGLLAVAAHYATFLLPSVLFLFRKSSRPLIASAAAGLALWPILQMIDSLHNTALIAVTTLLGGSLTGLYLGDSGWRRRASADRPQSRTTTPGHATYRVGDITAKPDATSSEVQGIAFFVFSVACLLYVFGHGRVEGQEGPKFVGGLGSALLFAGVGAAVAGSPRRALPRVLGFGLAFGVLGITFNLGLHPSSRPFWSADILQGMALSGLVVAVWRRVTGGGAWAYPWLVAFSATWWVFEPWARGFPGSQYLFEPGSGGLSLFPVLPWLTLSALGAWLFEIATVGRLTLACVLGFLAAIGWSLGPIKFPLNPIYAMTGGALASTVFALAGLCRSSVVVSKVSDWLGARWLLFFYLHLGIAPVLERLGLVQPFVGWVALALLSIGATWLVSAVMARVRRPFQGPLTWVILGALILAVGFCPGLPGLAVLILSGGLGLVFASRLDDLASLVLGRELDAPSTLQGESPMLRDLALIGLALAFLLAPEVVSRLPSPYGLAPRPVDHDKVSDQPGSLLNP